jgi:peroxiredoxin
VVARFRKGEDAVRITIPTSYTLALEPGTCIGGFVQNEQGEAIEGTTIDMRISGGEKSDIERIAIGVHREKTDANGFWQCDIMPAKLSYVGVQLAHPEYIDDESYYARSAPPIKELREMTGVMVMKKGVDLVGTVVDLKGQPIAKANLKQGTERRGIRNPRTETDSEGRFVFKNTKPGTVLLTVQAKGYAPDLKEIMVREGMRSVDFRLGPSQTIRGRVVDSQDKPLEDVDVWVRSWRGRNAIQWRMETDATGYFEWNEAPKDEVLFRFAKKGYMPFYELPLLSSVDEHIIVMYRALRVSGTVVDVDSNEPIRNFRLIWGIKWENIKQVHWEQRQAVELTNGRYEHTFTSPYDGHFIRIEADGYVPSISRMFYSDEGDVVFNFALGKGKGPSGVLYLGDGERAEGAEVALFRTGFAKRGIQNGRFADEGEQEFVVTGADGQFSLPPQDDKYLLVVVHNEGYAEITDEELAMDPNIFIEPWGRVEGVLRVGGQHGAKEMISLEYYRRYEPNLPWVSFDYQTVTDANGNFALERVVPGKAKVFHYYRPSNRRTTKSHSEVVEVLAGETTMVTIGGEGRPVVGRFVLPADCNRPVNWPNAMVTLALKLPEAERPENFQEMLEPEKRAWNKSWRQSEEGKAYTKMEWEQGRFYSVGIERDGRFRAEDVPAGTYKLQVTLSDTPGRAWWGGRTPGPSVEPQGFTGTLTHEFEVPDMNEGWSDEPLDLGSLEIEIDSVLMVGDAAPGFEAEIFDGNSIKLADYSGKVVAVVFWTTKEPWTTQKLLEMDEIYKAFSKDERFIMLGVSLDSDIDAAGKLVEDNKLKWINCYLTRASRVTVCKDYKIERCPSTFVIGPDGKILAKDPSDLLLKSTLEEALGAE